MLTERLEMWINLNKKKMKYDKSQRCTFDRYLRQIKDLEQRRTVVKERAQKIFQKKKEVRKIEQDKDEMKTEMEEEIPYVQGIKVEKTDECLMLQVGQQTENMRNTVCLYKTTLPIVNETSLRAAASTPSLDQVHTMSSSDASTLNACSKLKQEKLSMNSPSQSSFKSPPTLLFKPPSSSPSTSPLKAPFKSPPTSLVNQSPFTLPSKSPYTTPSKLLFTSPSKPSTKSPSCNKLHTPNLSHRPHPSS